MIFNEIFKNHCGHSRGQALFEFLVFTPLLLGLIVTFLSVSSAINGNINQQKALRGYIYNIMKGNPFIISNNDLKLLSKERASFFAIGYNEKNQGEKPFATCYKMHLFGNSNGGGENCDSSGRSGSDTRFIRVLTVYGLCAATFLRPDGKFFINFEDPSCVLK